MVNSVKFPQLFYGCGFCINATAAVDIWNFAVAADPSFWTKETLAGKWEEKGDRKITTTSA